MAPWSANRHEDGSKLWGGRPRPRGRPSSRPGRPGGRRRTRGSAPRHGSRFNGAARALKAALLCLLCVSLKAEIIDRVVVSVGDQVVTEYRIHRAAEMAAFLNGGPVGLSGPDRRAIADQLVEQALIRREIGLSRFSPVPRADVEQQIARIQKDLKLDDAGLRARLASYSLSYDDLYEEVKWQLTLYRFIDFRFRPGVQVSEDEVQVYYDGEFTDAVKKAGGVRPPLEDVHDDIVSVLTERKVQAAIEQWAEQVKEQVRIRYREEAFQ